MFPLFYIPTNPRNKWLHPIKTGEPWDITFEVQVDKKANHNSVFRNNTPQLNGLEKTLQDKEKLRTIITSHPGAEESPSGRQMINGRRKHVSSV